jgi:hypothetical protein
MKIIEKTDQIISLSVKEADEDHLLFTSRDEDTNELSVVSGKILKKAKRIW